MSSATVHDDRRMVLRTFPEIWDAFRARDLRQGLYDAGGVVMDGTLITLHGRQHKLRRRIENRLFRRGTFKWWEQHLVPAIIDEAFTPAIAAGRADLNELGYRTIMNLTARVAGADRQSSSEEETAALLHFAVKFSEGATLVHTTRDPAEVRAEVTEALQRFDRMFVEPSYRRRLALADPSIAEEDRPRDVLMAMVLHAEELEVDRELMLREVAFYLQAGSHSTADAFVHAADEILRWSAANPDRREDLADDTFVQRCVHEVFRLHPASPVAWRQAMEDVVLRSGPTIGRGQLVELDLRAGNRDPDVFGADAGRFNPDRDLPAGVPPWGHTFGGGMHACIGMELDGGNVPRFDEGVDPRVDHVLGTVPLMIRELLRNNASQDPDHSPTKDTHSSRDHFATYPVVFDAS